ncbi:MAG: hypothetical protein ABI970_23995 [Chloroflexota bacterium]
MFNVSSPTPILIAQDDNSSTGNRQPTFSWSAANAAVSYEIQLDYNYPPASTPFSTAATNYVPFVPLLTTNYYWRVHAIRTDATVTDWSPTRTVIIISPANAAPPRNIMTTHTPTLTWGRVSWAIGYGIQVDTDPNFGSPDYQDDTLTANSLAATTNPLPNNTYYWRVRAKKTDGTWSGWSASDSFVHQLLRIKNCEHHHDGAKQAGVAPIIVSRVINNDGYVSKEMQRKGEAALFAQY